MAARDSERQTDASDGKLCSLETLWKLLAVKDVDNILYVKSVPQSAVNGDGKLLLNQVGAGVGSF